MADQTEKRKMIAGQLYRANDDLLRAERRHAKAILRAFNRSEPGDDAERTAILEGLFGSLGRDAEVEPPFFCDYGYNIRVGDLFYANCGCVILDCAAVTIGSNVFLGPNVQIYTATHPLLPEEREGGLEAAKPIAVGDSVWIGGSTVVNPGVTIGRGTTIGAGSVVTRDVPPDVFAAGNPCRVIRVLR